MTRFSFTIAATDGAARTGTIAMRARGDPHAGLHAGRHRGDGQGDEAAGRARVGRRHHPRQHLSSDAPARAPSGSRGSAGCTASWAGSGRS